MENLPQTEEEYVKIILKLGPYTEQELRAFPAGKLGEYIWAMKDQIRRLGVAQFAQEKGMLRRGVEAQILRDPTAF